MANETPTTIGAEIRRIRKSMGLTLQDFGPLVGLPWQTLQGYESGRMTPPADKLLMILHATRRAPSTFRVLHVARALAA